MAWMPINNHPTVKPTYDFSTTTNWDAATGTGRTAISNGRPVGFTNNAADANFPGGSRTWTWKSSEPIANYLVENSVGNYDRDEYLSPSGVLFSHFQASGIAPATKVTNLATMKMQEDIMNFQTQFNGPFPFNADGVIIGLPTVSFAEEMQTKITFQGGRISLGTLNHENMHQWWGDNVSEDRTSGPTSRRATPTCPRATPRPARRRPPPAASARRPVTRRSTPASITRFNTTYNSTSATTPAGTSRRRTRRTRTCSATRPTRARAAPTSRCAQILGKDNFNSADQEIQTHVRRQLDHAAAADRDLQEVDAEQVDRLLGQARRVLQAVVGHGLRRLAGGRQQAADHGPGPGRRRVL